MTPKLLTPDEVARWLRISRRKVYNLCHARRIEHINVGNAIRFTEDALLAYLDRSTVKVPAESNSRPSYRPAPPRRRFIKLRSTHPQEARTYDDDPATDP